MNLEKYTIDAFKRLSTGRRVMIRCESLVKSMSFFISNKGVLKKIGGAKAELGFFILFGFTNDGRIL